jgi:hypothetical protein
MKIFFEVFFLRVLKNKQNRKKRERERERKNTHDDEELDPPGNDKQCTARVCIIKKRKKKNREGKKT